MITLYRLVRLLFIYPPFDIFFDHAERKSRRYDRKLYLQLVRLPKESWSLGYNRCGGRRFTGQRMYGRPVAIERTYAGAHPVTGVPQYATRISMPGYFATGSKGFFSPGCIMVDWLYKKLCHQFRREIAVSRMEEGFSYLPTSTKKLAALSEQESLYCPLP